MRISATPTRVVLAGAALLLATSGCTIVEAPDADESLRPARFSRRDIEHYLQLPTVAIDDGSRRWLVAPEAILELTDGFLNFEFTEEEGLSGTILAVDHDRTRIWVGTTDAVQSLDKDRHFLRTYAEEPGLRAVYVRPFFEGYAVAMTGRGAMVIDSDGLGVEIHPEPAIDIREVTDVELYDDDLWVSTFRGLHRFDLTFKRWNGTFGGKEVKRSRILRLSRVPNFIGSEKIGESLYAITETGLFLYDPTFDNWERVGL